MDDIQDQIEKRMAELPADIQNLILSKDLEKEMQDIGAAHQLHVDQIGALADEVMLTMLGFSDINQFASTIAAQVKVSSDEAQKIAAEVGEKVFLPIRESLKKFTETRAQTTAPAQMPAPKPIQPPTPPAAAPQMPPAPAPQPAAIPLKPAETPKELENPLARPELPMAEKMLAQKTVVTPPPAPPAGAPAQKPAGYKADPYREPVE